MSLLNQDIERPTDPTVLKSFRYQSMRKILPDAGHELYKFTSHPLLGSPKGITPYWFSVSPLEGDRGSTHDSGLPDRRSDATLDSDSDDSIDHGSLRHRSNKGWYFGANGQLGNSGQNIGS